MISQCIALPDDIKKCFEKAKKWRNILHHLKDQRNLSDQEFNTRWDEGCKIIQDLRFIYNTDDLKNSPLDSNVSVLLQALQNYVATLKPEMDRGQDEQEAIKTAIRKLQTQLDAQTPKKKILTQGKR